MALPLLGNPNLARIIFARRNVQPPTTLYVTPNDYLAVRLLSPGLGWSKAYVRLRLLNVYGEVKHMQYVIGEPYWVSEVSARYPLDEGQLLGVEVTPSNSNAHRGGIFAVVELTRQAGAIGGEHAILAANYTNYYSPIGWPTSRPQSPSEGPGLDRFFQLGSPGSGTHLYTTMPLFARWQVKSVSISLTTDATAANRQVLMVLSSSAGYIYVLAEAAAVQGASATNQYRFTQASTNQSNVFPGSHLVSIPPGLWIRSNEQVGVFVRGIRGGDTLSQSQWWIETAVNL